MVSQRTFRSAKRLFYHETLAREDVRKAPWPVPVGSVSYSSPNSAFSGVIGSERT